MASPDALIGSEIPKSPPPLPLDADHWTAVAEAMELSSQQARIVELVLCDHSTKEIGRILQIGEATVKTYLDRIAARTGTRGRMQLAMHVLRVSHEVAADRNCPPKG
jgi:DNA-binding NarL/FixJ family response regulator